MVFRYTIELSSREYSGPPVRETNESKGTPGHGERRPSDPEAASEIGTK
jgi:hypothetical protein